MKRYDGCTASSLVLLALIIPSIAWSASHASIVLERDHVPASGEHRVILNVSEFGRYAIWVTSSQGTSLQLVDRMAGPGEIRGQAGTRDGRLDTFLDEGEYLIITRGHPKASGEAVIHVSGFSERDDGQARTLVELRAITGSLDDFEQISYWIEVTTARRISLEAAGRNLGDLRIWQDGIWLHDAMPETEIVTPEPGKPLNVRRLSADVNPGLVRLTLYGGEATPWPDDTGEHPFILHAGIPRLPDAGRWHLQMNMMGRDRWIVPKTVNFFRLELHEPGTAAMLVGNYFPDQPYRVQGRWNEITLDSREPMIQVTDYPDTDTDREIVITGKAGQTYTLQVFQWTDDTVLKTDGEYALTSLHAGDPQDSIDATAIITRTDPEDMDQVEIMDSRVIELGAGTFWHRRFNVMEPLTAFFHVSDPGQYMIQSRGIRAMFRLEPFLVHDYRSYQPPASKNSGELWDLDAGFYVLTVSGTEKGIIEMAVYPAAMSFSWDLFEQPADMKPFPRRTACTFPRLQLDHDVYNLFLNKQSSVISGWTQRKLPLDLSAPFPIFMDPGQPVPLNIRIPENGRIVAMMEDRSLLNIRTGDGSAKPSWDLASGTYSIAVESPVDDGALCSLTFESELSKPGAALPVMPPEKLGDIPTFPVVTLEQPLFFDLEMHGSQTFIIHADQPGLYRVETTGLLATQGSLRTRLIPMFDQSAQNGSGRNFLLQHYLREGDYQVTVRTLGSSNGHLGLEIARTNIIDGGNLRDGIPGRATLHSGEAIQYTLTILQGGRYRITSNRLSSPAHDESNDWEEPAPDIWTDEGDHEVDESEIAYDEDDPEGEEPDSDESDTPEPTPDSNPPAENTMRCRLDDPSGWPVIQPGRSADFDVDLQPGDYRLIILPEPFDTRCITMFTPVTAPKPTSGHGPHRLPLGKPISGFWRESPDRQNREPDVWVFTLPALLDLSITLTSEMKGVVEIEFLPEIWQPVAEIAPGIVWKGQLAQGRYRLGVVCDRINDHLMYSVDVSPSQLTAGCSRSVDVPIALDVAVGRDTTGQDTTRVEIFSRGFSDVRAVLLDHSGGLVAAGDDRPDDWNFYIHQRLTPGSYVLRIEPVGANSTTCDVVMASPEQQNRMMTMPFDEKLTIHDQVCRLSTNAPDGSNMLIFQAQSIENLIGAIGNPEGDGEPITGKALCFEVPAAPGMEIGLQLYAMDQMGNPIRCSGKSDFAGAETESSFKQGIPLKIVGSMPSPVAMAYVELDRPGIFRMDRSMVGKIRYSDRMGTACRTSDDDLLISTTGHLWLSMDVASGSAGSVIQAERVELAPGDEFHVTLDSSRWIQCNAQKNLEGPVLVQIHAMSGQPGIFLSEPEAVSDFRPDARWMAVGNNAATSVSLSENAPVICLWNAAPYQNDRVDATVTVYNYSVPVMEPISDGLWSGRVSKEFGRLVQLPPGRKQLMVSLGDHAVGVLSRNGRVERLLWHGDQSFMETCETEADHLLVLGTGDQASFVTTSVSSIGQRSGICSVTEARSFEQPVSMAGILDIDVSNPSPDQYPMQMRLKTAGFSELPIFLSGTGNVYRSADILLDHMTGRLQIPHQPGIVLAWIDRSGQPGETLWGDRMPEKTTTVTLPGTVSLSHPAQTMVIEEKRPIMLHLKTQIPAVAKITVDDRTDVRVYLDGCIINEYLPNGNATIALRGVAGENLRGDAVMAGTEVIPMTSVEGAPFFLSPGDGRMVSFDVKRKGTVGIGIRTDSSSVICHLMDRKGNRLGTGISQMPELLSGTYLLALQLPAGSAPAEAQPIVVGLDQPGTGPPEDVIRHYLEFNKTVGGTQE